MKSKPVKIDGPVQLSLFTLLPENQKYSNTIELYDAIPKFVLGKDKKGDRLDPIQREFVHKGSRYRVVISPAKIKDENGNFIDALPGQREEFIEDALRKLATEGKMVTVGSQVGVTFSLYKLKNELARTGHNYSYKELKEALKIMVSCNMELVSVLESGKREEIYNESLFSRLGGKTEDGWIDSNENSKSMYFVIFNSLVKKSILALTFRRFNYEVCMGYTNAISRYLHKRMSHNYVQASFGMPYVVSLESIIEGSGMRKYPKASDNHQYVLKALNEMQEKSVIRTYSSNGSGGDYIYTIEPHHSFIKEVKAANAIQKENRVEATRAGVALESGPGSEF